MMTVLSSTRLLLLFGETVQFNKLSNVSRNVLCRSTKRFFGQLGYDQGPLTLSSLGFKVDSEDSCDNKVNKHVERNCSIGGMKSRLKAVKSNELQEVKAVKSFEIDIGLFAAKSFSEFGLPPGLLGRLDSEGLDVPTEVQATAIPTVRKGHDAVIQSYTGSGKTLAYVLPILCEVGPFKYKSPDDEDEYADRKEIEAVVVAPSRELGMQIVREFERLLGPADKTVVQQLVGGANPSRQEEALKKNKPAIIVGTPGRIAKMSAAGKLKTHNCRFLVLDEVDELLSFNFRDDMHRILEHVGRKSGSRTGAVAPKSSVSRRFERQTVMVSATVPFSVIRAARSWQTDPVLVQAKKVMPIESVSPTVPVTLSGATSGSAVQSQAAAESLPPALKHFYCVTKLQHKVDALRRCVHALDAKTVIVFMNHTKQLRDVVFKLEARGLKAAEFHGDLGKLARSTVLKDFKNGKVRMLVTNEISARGIDVAECDLVVNLDLPTDAIHYAHRAGRTGRLGRKGVVVSICEEAEVFVVKKLQKHLSVPILSCEFAEGKLVPN